MADRPVNISNVTNPEFTEFADGVPIFHAYYDELTVLDQGYKELKASLQRVNEQTRQRVKDQYEENLDEARLAFRVGRPTDFVIEDTNYMKRSDTAIVSFLTEEYSFLGGAHPYTSRRAHSFDPYTGKELSLKDVVVDYRKLYDYVSAKLEEINESKEFYHGYFDGYQDVVRNIFFPDEDTSKEPVWTMDNQGISIYFDAYVLGPYVRGETVVEVPFQDMPELFVSKYIPASSSISYNKM